MLMSAEPCLLNLQEREITIALCCRHEPDDDLRFAFEMQRQEMLEHAQRLTEMQHRQHGNVDVDSMSYESLSLLGDTVGTVKVRFIAHLQRRT
jgi:hypothetical protein